MVKIWQKMVSVVFGRSLSLHEKSKTILIGAYFLIIDMIFKAEFFFVLIIKWNWFEITVYEHSS